MRGVSDNASMSEVVGIALIDFYEYHQIHYHHQYPYLKCNCLPYFTIWCFKTAGRHCFLSLSTIDSMYSLLIIKCYFIYIIMVIFLHLFGYLRANTALPCMSELACASWFGVVLGTNEALWLGIGTVVWFDYPWLISCDEYVSVALGYLCLSEEDSILSFL